MPTEHYANADPKEWKRFFREYDRQSTDETGNVVIYNNSLEELYQMFKHRLREEAYLDVWGQDKKEVPHE